ncbi:DUF5667 domain-containing protein [Blastococcus sp. TF02A_35]|uniref:DUF5667 domain-containing protein n=1 Tax=Blastococcus sp. TF02A-35 TaxID=2559612 RepID=UPI00107456AF|nr:DUF5667 domain-containing protein [Blastococcus sp. TF02A_35]TFV53322.1 hypothetical protein E4P43_01935 [Blastococcus sp. TF02A_35]
MIRHDGTTAHDAASAGDREAAVVARLQSLATVLDDEPDAQYRARARARLVAMAAVRTPEPAPRPLVSRLLTLRAEDRAPSRWRGRLTAGLAGAAVGVTGLAALVAVAAGAQPGDPLYDLKRGTEQTQLALAGESRGQTLLELASTRLEELRTVTGDPALVESTLRTMDHQTTEAAALLTSRAVTDRDAETLADLAAWTDQQSAGLADLRDEVPAPADPAYVGSVDLLKALTTRTAGLSTALGCASGPATVGEDALGPVPGLCLADVPPPVAEELPAPPPVASPPGAPSVDPSSPPAQGPAPAPAPAPGGNGPGAAVPTPAPGGPAGSAPTQLPTPGGLLPTGPVLPLPGTPSGSAARPTLPPVIDVPLPGPIRICLPPLATVGNC